MSGARRAGWRGRAALLSLPLLGACAAEPPIAPPSPPPVVIHASDALRVTRLQSGWVSVKRRFREYAGPSALRLPAILLDRRWTEWFPIAFYLVEHAGGRLVFDTGETARVAEPDHFDCDPVTGWFYRTQLRFAVAADEELGAQLERLGISPASVDTAVLSHLHSDHIGGLGALGEATWLMSARDAAGHAGALTCRIPAHDDTRLITPRPDPFGAFADSHRVTADGQVRIVATPGHTAGHQSLLLRDGERWVLLAGDVVFDRERLANGRAMAGIVEDPAAARRSIAFVEAQLERFDTVLATAHDPVVEPHVDDGDGDAR